MNEVDTSPYVVVVDKHGGKASVYYSNSGEHEIIFSDDQNHKFFTEKYAECPIELVEKAAIDWAEGNRNLIGV